MKLKCFEFVMLCYILCCQFTTLLSVVVIFVYNFGSMLKVFSHAVDALRELSYYIFRYL